MRFLPADPPTPARMTAVLAQVHEAVLAAHADDDLDMDPTLRACVQRSLAGPHVAPAAEPVAPLPLTLSAFGMHLHAATTVDGRDRQQLERLCRYLLRPPFAQDAVHALPDGWNGAPLVYNGFALADLDNGCIPREDDDNGKWRDRDCSFPYGHVCESL